MLREYVWDVPAARRLALLIAVKMPVVRLKRQMNEICLFQWPL